MRLRILKTVHGIEVLQVMGMEPKHGDKINLDWTDVPVVKEVDMVDHNNPVDADEKYLEDCGIKRDD